jgi:hypothetical protein
MSSTGMGHDALPANPAQSVVMYSTPVMIVMPWQKAVSPITAFCVAQLIDRRRTSTMLNYGDAFVAHTRNACADMFLQSKSEWMLTIDDDMLVPFGAPVWYREYTGFNFPDPFMGWNTIDRLMSHKKSLVGATYFSRNPFGIPVYNEGIDPREAEYVRNGPYDIIKPTRWVGTGCLLIHRSVFEDIEKRFPRLARGPNGRGGNWFTSTEASLLDQTQRLHDLLTSGPLTMETGYKALAGLQGILAAARNENTLGAGEDVSFCQRAMSAGHQPHVDLGLICGHTGTCVYGPHNTRNKKQ